MTIDLQAFYRGHLVRLNRKRKLSMIQAKLTKATEQARRHPDTIIGNRTSSAISTLKTHASNMSQNRKSSAGAVSSKDLMDACIALEVSTEVSKACCKKIIRGEASSLLLHLIRTCDRSKESQEILRYVVFNLQKKRV